MPKKFEFYKKKADLMIADDVHRDKAFKNYESMFHCDWNLPEDIEGIDWIRKVISTDPHDAIAAGTRVLSGLDPLIKLQPLSSDQDTKTLANETEKVLKWQLKSLNRRRQGGIVSDIVFSALMYDEVALQVIDLDFQIPQMEMLQGETKRLKAARRYGRFAINVYNPSDVHVRYSGLMPESALLCVMKSGFEILGEWGEAAKEIEGHEEKNFLFYDYLDYDTRCVWAEPKEGGGEVKIVPPIENTLPFFNWVAMVGSPTFEDKAENKRQPVLYSVYRSGNWETQNVVKTLYTSEVVAHAAAPRTIEEGNNPDRAEIDYADPARGAKAPPGNTVKPLAPPPIDQALTIIDDRIGAAIDRSTVARILQNADIPPGTAFATLNLATQTAVGALKPSKRLAENALSETLTIMLLLVNESKKPLMGFGDDKRDGSQGKQYVIEPGAIAADSIYIDVELKPDIPTDRQQRINAATMAVQGLNYPREYALEDIGVADPQAAEEARFMEIMSDAMIQNQLAAMATQQQFQQQLMNQMALAQIQQATQGGGAEPTQTGSVDPGQAYNPRDGGQPAAIANPQATFEGQTGQTRGGNGTEIV
jgi:hypothetical protein